MSGLLEHLFAFLFPPRPDPVCSLGARLGRRAVARGRVVPRDLIASPLTGAACVYYRYVVEEWRETPVALGGGGAWTCVDQDEAIAEFYVDDGTGRALVLPARAAVLGARRPHGVDVPSGQRASELRIAPGDLVEVEGIAGETEDLLGEDRGYRERAARALLEAPEGESIRIRVVTR